MKKKILLAITSLLTSTLVVSALLFSKNGNNFANNVHGNESRTFALSNEGGTLVGENLYEVKLRSESNVVNVEVENASEAKMGVGLVGTADDETEMYLYNTDPFRGISHFHLEFNKGVIAMVHFSYNPITTEKLYDQTYQDLLTFCSFDTTGGEGIDLNVSDYHELSGVRYFYVNINSLVDNYNISEFEVTTECAVEPEAVEEGENLGVLTSEEKSTLASAFHVSSDVIPDSVGNGTFAFGDSILGNEYGQIIYGESSDSHSFSTFVSTIASAFSMNNASAYGENAEIYYFQKRNGDDVDTIMVLLFHGHYSNILFAGYDNRVPWMGGVSGWPQEQLESAISAAHRDLIVPFPDENVEMFNLLSPNTVGIAFKAGLTDDQIAAICLAYVDQYVSNGFYYYPSSEGRQYTMSYPDGLFTINLSYVSELGMYLITFHEIVREPFPSSETLAAGLGISNPAYVPVYPGEKLFANMDYQREPGCVSFYASAADYTFSSQDMLEFSTAIINAGFTTVSVSDYSQEYSKMVDRYGSYLRIYFTDSGYVRYSYYSISSSSWYSVNSFGELLTEMANLGNVEIDPDVVAYAEANVALDPSFTYEVSGTDDAYGFISGAGQEFIDSYAALDGVRYVEYYNAYSYQRMPYGFRFEIMDGGVFIRPVGVSPFNTTVDYTYFNKYITNNVSDSDYRLLLSEEDNLPDNFVGNCFYGSTREVNAFKELIFQKLRDLGFTYSDYTGKFYKAREIDGVETYSSYEFTIYTASMFVRFNDFDNYEDYSSYNALDLDQYGLLELFPEFVSDKDSNVIYVENDSLPDTELRIAVKGDIEASYEQALVNAGFTFNSGDYYKILSDGRYIEVSCYAYNGKTIIDFSNDYIFKSCSGKWTEYSSIAKDFADVLGIDDYFTASTPKYFIDSADSNYFRLNLVESSEDITSFMSHLETLGFAKENHGDTNIFRYTNSENTLSYWVRINIWNIARIDAFKTTSTCSTFTSVVNSSNFDKDDVTSVVYPSSSDAVFTLLESNKYQLQVRTTFNFDIEAYKTALRAVALSYQDSDYYSLCNYHFEDGDVNIDTMNEHGYLITFTNTDIPGGSFDNPFIAATGSTDFLIGSSDMYFEYTPNSSGFYQISSNSGWGVRYVLYNESKTVIADTNDLVYSGTGLYATLDGGETYYICLKTDIGGDSLYAASLNIRKMNVTNVSLGTTSFTVSKNLAYFMFTAPESGMYTFESSCDEDTYAYLYDYNLREITSDDDSAGDRNFRINYYLEAGETVFVGSRLFDVDSTSQYSCSLIVSQQTA